MGNAIDPRENLRPVINGIVGVSGLVCVFLLWFIYYMPRREPDPAALNFLPAVNAGLNGMAALCITTGLVAIKLGKRRVHITMMATALTLTALFLVSYLTYHYLHGDTKFLGEGALRFVYFFVLISHVVATIFALPLILCAVFFALTRRFELHKRVTKYTAPIWLYVSVTGVAIYFLLKANS